jgi:hypothetical protein
MRRWRADPLRCGQFPALAGDAVVRFSKTI